MDPVDAIMAVMHEAFDPAYGEAWTRAQVSDALILPSTHYRLALGQDDRTGRLDAQGFTLSRLCAEEEELLLIAVRPQFRGRGIGTQLLQAFCADAKRRGARNLFLEMREGNHAEILYRAVGFTRVGRRKDYYRHTKTGPLDALTFKLSL